MKSVSSLIFILCLGTAFAQTPSPSTRTGSDSASTSSQKSSRTSAAQSSAAPASTTNRSSRVAPGFGQVVLSAGSSIEVSINESLSSDAATAGDRFTGTVTSDVLDRNGNVIIPRNADVSGRVLRAVPSGRLTDSGELELSINTIRSGSQVANVTVEPFLIKGESHTKSNTTKIGGGAALGAIIGAIAGGGKGAAIGAGVGGAAGAGAAAATGRREAKVESEANLKFVTSTEIAMTPMRVQNSNSGTRAQEPELRRRDSGSDTGTTTPSSSSTSSSTSATGSSTTTEAAPLPNEKSHPTDWGYRADVRAFSLRDRRVLSQCMGQNSPLSQNATNARLSKGSTVSSALQGEVRALPLACDRELPSLPNDLERATYGRQVLLLDSQGTILDTFDLPQQ